MKPTINQISFLKMCVLLVFVLSSYTDVFATIYTNDMDYVIGDVKQALITDKVNSSEDVEKLILGFKNLGVNGIRFPIYAEGCNPNEFYFRLLYNRAVAEGFLIFANPAQSSGGHRIACGMLNDGDLYSVKDDPIATSTLIETVKIFALMYPCKWINPFNEDGRPDAAWSTDQMNRIYGSLYGNVNGAELIGSCAWGIPASIDVFNNTDISDYITVAATHNLGFNHSSWPTFIAAAKAKGLPVWDSEVNHNDAKGNGTRLEKAIEYEVDGLVMYNIWKTIQSDGSISDGGKAMMSLYLKDINVISSLPTSPSSDVSIYPNPASSYFNIVNAVGADFEIFNCAGEMILTHSVSTNAQNVDISDFEDGMYFVRINNNGVTSTHKLLKE